MTDTARRAWTLIAPTQSNKATTANDRFQDIENALDDLLSVDLTAGSVTLSAAEWSGSAGFYLAGTSTSGRTVTVPAQEGPRDFYLDAAWTHSVSIVRGATTVTLAPGKGARVFADGTANGLRVIAATSVDYAAVTGRKVKIGIGYEASLATVEVFARWIADEAVNIPAGLTASVFACATPDAGAATVLSVAKNGTPIGTITIGTTGTITISFASLVAFAIGDVLTVAGPATPTTAAGFVGTIVATA